MKKILIFTLLFCVAVVIFLVIKNPNTGFNIIPYSLFLLLSKNASEGGEHFFILIFDGLFSTVLVYGLYKIVKEIVRAK